MNRLVQLTFFLFLCETVEKKKKMQTHFKFRSMYGMHRIAVLQLRRK